MVASTTLPANNGNGSTHENEKRRKQTIERARANHLSRQLQMRLQYARLKVDHGWQKQNLNEVENLYFHHSHHRGPTKPSSPSVTTTTVDESTSQTGVKSPSPIASQSSRLSSLSRGQNNASLDSASPSQNENLPSGAPISQSTLPQNVNQIVPTSASNPSETSNLIQMEVEPESKPLPVPLVIPAPTHYAPPPAAGPSFIPDYSRTLAYSAPTSSGCRSDHIQPPTPISTPWVATGSRPPAASSTTNHTYTHYPNIIPALSRQSTMPLSPSSSSESVYGFPNVSLTYDSFWSSHSSSASARSFRSSLGSIPPGTISGPNGMGDAFSSRTYQAQVEPVSGRQQIGTRGGE